jgi:poly-gamma-glutamate capsule biosynthesis protein CapA/YwtB (metallophosphatase superfamily)
VIQEFFKLQSNLELLTPGLKNQLEDYLKLTKTGKQEKAQQMFDAVFEPALEMLKRTKRAEALSRGHGLGGSGDDAYKEKINKVSRSHYLGEKH